MDSKKAVIHHAYNLEYYKPKLWEHLILAFCPMLKSDGPLGCVYYKNFADRLYIYKREYPALERPKVPFTGGANTPWLN